MKLGLLGLPGLFPSKGESAWLDDKALETSCFPIFALNNSENETNQTLSL